MEGRLVSHYRILERVGSGGMGVVYKAEDVRLHRAVALKFLLSSALHDTHARERFEQEARAASALEHQNICTIHEIDSTEDGQLFIAMAYCDGESLAARLQRGALTIKEATATALQIARGLDKAHQSGLVHRDIKPANVMSTSDGVMKIVDFGIARVGDQTGVTRTGTTLGTVAFMSPEQVRGEGVDARTDLWALGVVLFEMIAGQRPFKGESEAAVLNNILTVDPPRLSSLRPGVPTALDTIAVRLLKKKSAERYASSSQVIEDLQHLQASLDESATPPRRTMSFGPRARWLAAAIAVIALAAAAAVGLTRNRQRDEAARAEDVLADAIESGNADRFAEAFVKAKAVEAALGAERVRSIWQQISQVRSIDSDPPGALVSVRAPLDPKAPWIEIGRTPLVGVRIPAGVLRIRVEKEGFTPIERIAAAGSIGVPGGGAARRGAGAGPQGNAQAGVQGARGAPVKNDGQTDVQGRRGGRGGGRGAGRGGGRGGGASPEAGQSFHLSPVGSMPDDMLAIAAARVSVGLVGYDIKRRYELTPYLMDKFEVTNRQFKKFVDADGYEKREFWKEVFVKQGRTVSWEDAIAQFRDRTGRPGPSTWEVGTYPDGQDDFPVSGVSWYEAAAYAEFAGKSLPTVLHWSNAASTEDAAFVVPLSNLEGKGPAAVGAFTGVTIDGLYDMAGNVKEWCLNEMSPGGGRYILGGAWSEPAHMFTFADSRPAFDRSDTNGIRLMSSFDRSASASLTAPIPGLHYEAKNQRPVSDIEYEAYRRLFSYDPRDLAFSVDATDESNANWTALRVSYTTAYGSGRMSASLFLPKNATPPYKTVIFFPTLGALTNPNESPQAGMLSFLMLSGRAVLFPAYEGTFDRNTGETIVWPEMTSRFRDQIVHLVNDVRRSIDFLDTRDDIQHDSIAYLGESWGAAMAPLALPNERRLKTAVLVSGGLVLAEMPPETSLINAAPRVKVPVLMINGDQDNIFPRKESQDPLLELLGTPKADKNHIVYPAGHGVWGQMRNQVRKDILDWLDRYQGTVKR